MTRGNGNTIIALLAFAILSACGNLRVIDNCSCGFYTTQAGTILPWQDGSNVKFTFDKNFPAQEKASVLAATDSYNNTFTKTRISVDTAHDNPTTLKGNDYNSVSGDGENGIYWMPNPWPWQAEAPDADAMTVVKFSDSNIIEADIFFRGESFPLNVNDGAQLVNKIASIDYSKSFKTEQDLPTTAKWVYAIAVHEFGHAMGLVHTKSTSSVMFPEVPLRIFYLDNPFSAQDLKTLQMAYQIKGGLIQTAETRTN